MCSNLIKAVKNNDFIKVKQLVKGCTLLDSQEKYTQRTALHYAFQREAFSIAKFLLKSGARTDIKDSTGVSVDDVVLRNKRINYSAENKSEREIIQTSSVFSYRN